MWLGADDEVVYLVSLHGFQHTEATDVDDTDLVTLTRSWVQIHQRHNVLGVLPGRQISSDVHNLPDKRYS